MDDIILEKIFELVKNSNGIKASEIAKQLKISRKEVNRILYGRLAKVCLQDEHYMWYCSSDTPSDRTASSNCLTKMESNFLNTDFTVEELEAFLKNIEN